MSDDLLKADGMEIVQANTPFPATTYPVDPQTDSGGMGFWVGGMFAPMVKGLPPYWSPGRDAWLREFVTRCDPLAVATATFINKAVSVPARITAVDSTIKRHNELAAELEWNLTNYSGFLRGFKEEFKKFAFDYLTNDNGAFMLVLGRGPANGPIMGKATGMIHLDSARCQRTGDPIYPVIYMHLDGKRYAMHYTRVISMANMPSPRAEMFGVGLCAASCAIEAAQELKDIAVYSSEKMGSRPARQILYVRTGATLEQLKGAVNIFEHKMASDDYQRFAKTLLLAPKVASQTLDLQTVDLASVPDGFDREKVTVLDLSMLAAAYGLDLHDLSVSLGVGGQTRSTAETQAKKGRGKGVHEFLETFADQARRRFLPDTLTVSFDEIDDDADEQRARSRDVRSQYRERDLRSGVTTVRTERVEMLRNGDLTQEDFNELELADGRTPEGLDILFLFHSQDAELKSWLGNFAGAADPTDITNNDGTAIIEEIQRRKVEVYKRIESAPNARVSNLAKMALAALQKLQTMYQEMPAPEMELNERVALEAMDSQEPPPEADEPTDNEDETLPVDATGAPVDAESEVAEKQLPFGETARSLAENADLTYDDMMVVEQVSSIYERDFQAILSDAVQGRTTQAEFDRAMEDLIASVLLYLFLRGSRITLAELTPNAAATQTIRQFIDVNRASLTQLSADVYSGRYSPERLTLDGAMLRSRLWVNMSIAAFTMGQLERRDNPRFRWVRNWLKDSCGSCLRLEGQVHTAAAWKASGWMPRAQKLECGGYLCGCSLVETTEPESGTF